MTQSGGQDDQMFDDFELRFGFAGHRVTVGVLGELDMLTTPALAGGLLALIATGHDDLVLDLGGTTFIDAAGLDALADLAARVRHGGCVLALRSVDAFTRRMLDITGVSDLVEFDELTDSEGLPAVQSLELTRARGRSSTDVVDAALRLVTALADAVIANAEGASVTLERHGRLMTVAASNDAVLIMDRHQYDTGEGPCLAAKAEGRRIYIESLAEETRWPRFVPLALGQGIMSIMSSPLMSGDRPHGALNFYSSTERAFGPKEQELAALFAKQASEIVATSGTDATARTSGERFAQALSSRRTIHQAQGIIMARDGVAADEAHQTILSGARAAGATVASYAAGVVASVGHVDRTA